MIIDKQHRYYINVHNFLIQYLILLLENCEVKKCDIDRLVPQTQLKLEVIWNKCYSGLKTLLFAASIEGRVACPGPFH